MKNLYLIISLLLLISEQDTWAQTPLDELEPYSPVPLNSRVSLDVDSYYYVAENKSFSFRPGFYYGLPNKRHVMGMSVPVIHSIFTGDFAGYENTTGIGDFKFTYVGVPYQSRDLLGFTRLSFYAEVTAPTGNEQLGRGVGAWVYKPGIVANIQAIPNLILYPQVNFQFSTDQLNSLGGGDGLPDPEDPDLEDNLQVLGISLPAVLTVTDVNAWFSLNTEFLYSFSESTYFLFLRMDAGKMIGDRTSAYLQISKFIAGQPRLETLIRIRFNFFLGQ